MSMLAVLARRVHHPTGRFPPQVGGFSAKIREMIQVFRNRRTACYIEAANPHAAN
jgi:hypothetical protein